MMMRGTPTKAMASILMATTKYASTARMAVTSYAVTAARSYHIECLVPPIRESDLPEGDWHCPVCEGKEDPSASTEVKPEHGATASTSTASTGGHGCAPNEQTEPSTCKAETSYSNASAPEYLSFESNGMTAFAEVVD